MRRFITKRKVKIPRYKILSIKIVSFLLLFSFIYIIFSIIITKDNSPLLNIIGSNSFGNNLSSYNIYKNNKQLFYQNSFGSYSSTTKTSYNSSNLHELILSKPLIYIYNTFQTEKYKSTNNNDYNVNSVISAASLILSEYLKKEGIKSLVELENIDKLAQEKNYSSNYLTSKYLLNKAKKENPSLNYYFDLQISSASYSETTYETPEKNYAKIRFIIGTNYDSYKENLKFATLLNTKLTIQNSNLSRGISLEGGTDNEGIYNEDINSHVLLIEVGGKENTIAEVNNTLKVFASIIKEAINEEEKK